MAARHKEGYNRKTKPVSIYFLVCKGLTIDDDVGVSRDTAVSQEIRPGDGFESGDVVKRTVEGAYRRTTLLRNFLESAAPLPWVGAFFFFFFL